MSKQEMQQKGFTIIEVVLVLAIAALIFLMVFIALPALQRNQRDAERKDILGKVTSAVTTYSSNHRNMLPVKGVDLAGYMDGAAATGTEKSATDGSYTATTNDAFINNNYIVTVAAALGDGIGKADTNVVQIFTAAKCDPAGGKAIAGTNRGAAVLIKMENGNDVVCQDV